MKRFITLLFIMCVAVMTWGQEYSAELARKAQAGNAEAQYKLGLCYSYGWGITKDEAEAVKWFRKAAEQGLAKAQYDLGFCYYNGFGITEDKAEGVKWFRKAAEQGYEFAYFSLGLCHQYYTKNKEEAIYWYKKYANTEYGRDNEATIKSLKELGVDYSPGGSTSYASSSSSSSSSTSSRSTSSSKSKSELLYSGIYTKSSQGYMAELGQYTDGGFDFQVNVEIYNDYILINSDRYDYVKTSGEWKVYGGKDNFMGTTEYYYVNPSTYTMKYMTISSFTVFGRTVCTTTTYAMAKGEVIFQKQYNSNNGYSSSGSSYGSGNNNSGNGNNNGSGTTRRACTVCKYHVGECGVCKGTGKVTNSTNGYRTTSNCSNCGGTGKCPTCGGDGWR